MPPLTTSLPPLAPSLGAPSPIPWKRVMVVVACIFGDALNMMLVVPFVPFYVRELTAIDESQVGLYAGMLAGAYKLGQFVVSPLYGYLSDRLGRRPVMLFCMAVGPFALLAFAMAPTFVCALTFRLLQGASAGGVTVGKIYLADITDPSNEARVFSFVGFAMGLGVVVGPTLGGMLASPTTQYPSVFEPSAWPFLERYPYLLPCASSCAFSTVNLGFALALLPETRSGGGWGGARTEGSGLLAESLLVRRPSCSTLADDLDEDGHAVIRGHSALLDALGSYAGVSTQLVDWEVEADAEHAAADRSSHRHSTTAHSQLLRTLALSKQPSEVHLARTSGEKKNRIFLLLQLQQVLFTATYTGFSEILPVRLSAEAVHGGYAMSAKEIGALQAVGGLTAMCSVLFLFYRLVNSVGVVNALQLGLAANAVDFLVPLALDAGRGLPDPTLGRAARGGVGLIVLCMAIAIALGAFGNNAVMQCSVLLSKACVPPGKVGLAIGVNQSASSFGNAVGPVVAGWIYTACISASAQASAHGGGLLGPGDLLGMGRLFFVVWFVVALAASVIASTLPRWPWPPVPKEVDDAG